MKYTFLRFPAFRSKAVTLSYDDGVAYDRKLIEIMRANGLRGTFNINGGWFATEPNQHRLTKEDALALYTESGMEVAVHGLKHLSLGEVDPAMATRDVLEDRLCLEQLFGKIIKGMAYANGSFDDRVVEILKNCGIEYARTTRSTETFLLPSDWLRLDPTCHHKNPRLMELAKEFVELSPPQYYWSDYPRLFYLWGHSYEFNTDDNWSVIEEFAQYIGNREEIWYATNGELYDYVKAYEALRFSADGKTIHNPTAQTLWLNVCGTLCKVEAGETVRS